MRTDFFLFFSSKYHQTFINDPKASLANLPAHTELVSHHSQRCATWGLRGGPRSSAAPCQTCGRRGQTCQGRWATPTPTSKRSGRWGRNCGIRLGHGLKDKGKMRRKKKRKKKERGRNWRIKRSYRLWKVMKGRFSQWSWCKRCAGCRRRWWRNWKEKERKRKKETKIKWNSNKN